MAPLNLYVRYNSDIDFFQYEDPIGSGLFTTLPIDSSLLVYSGGTGFIPWAAVSKSGSSLADLATRSAGDLNSGTLPLARLSNITNTEISATAAIAYTKLNLSTSIVNADVNASAAIAWTKLSKSGSSLADLTTASAADLSSGTLSDSRLSTNVPLISGTVTISGTYTFTNAIKVSTLTSGRLVIAGTAGVLQDDSDITFSGDTLIITKISNTTSITTPLVTTGVQLSINGTKSNDYGIILNNLNGAANRQQGVIIDFTAGSSNANDPAFGIRVAGGAEVFIVRQTGVVNIKNFTVAGLPAGTRGDVAYVTDALAPTFLAVVVGGGTVVAPVFYNGANWVGF